MLTGSEALRLVKSWRPLLERRFVSVTTGEPEMDGGKHLGIYSHPRGRMYLYGQPRFLCLQEQVAGWLLLSIVRLFTRDVVDGYCFGVVN